MKYNINNILLALFIAGLCLSFYACEKDDTKPSKSSSSNSTTNNNSNLITGGSISAVVNDEFINDTEAAVNIYGGANTVAVVANNKVHEDTTIKLHVYVPLDPITGAFDHTDPGFSFSYEVVTFNNESGYTYSKERKSEINITSYDSIGTIADTTFYRVVGTFEFNAKQWANNDSVEVENGQFDFNYRI